MLTPDHVMSAPWWWECVSSPVGKAFGRIEAKSASGEVIASMPYQLTRRGPFKAMLMPELTQMGHLWSADGTDRGEALRMLMRELRAYMRRERVVMVQVADRLTDSDKDILSAEGFELQDRVSYQIAAGTTNPIALLSDPKRRKFKKADGHFTLDFSMTPSELYSALEKAYGTVRYPRALFLRLVSTATANGNGVILRAQAHDGTTAAAVFLATDSTTAYYMTPAIDPAHLRDGANEWLTVQAITYALSRGLTFDFEGSMNPNIANAYRHYGSSPAHYTFATLYRPAVFKWIVRGLTRLKK